MKVRWDPEALREAQEMEKWWRQNRPMAPDLFADELGGAGSSGG